LKSYTYTCRPSVVEASKKDGRWWRPKSKASFLFISFFLLTREGISLAAAARIWRFALHPTLLCPQPLLATTHDAVQGGSQMPRSSSCASSSSSSSSIPALSPVRLLPPSLVGPREPRTAFTSAFCSPLHAFSAALVSCVRQQLGDRRRRRRRPTPGAQVFVGSFAGEATSTHQACACAPPPLSLPFLLFGYLYSDPRADFTSVLCLLINFFLQIFFFLVVHVYCTPMSFNSTNR
jgi:hypothetical protein